MELASKIAIVTGASSGLGVAIVKFLIAEDAVVYGIARNEMALAKLKVELGKDFHPIVMDITSREAIDQWIATTFTDDVVPNILINNAGVGSFGKIDEIAPETWDSMIATNLTGMYNITAPVVRLMRATPELTHIINIGSILGSVTRSEGAAYSATKFGIRGFSESLFKELRGDNIKVTCVNPGSIDTGFFADSGIEAHQNMLQPEDLAAMIGYVLKTPDNMLINEITVRPLDPRKPK